MEIEQGKGPYDILPVNPDLTTNEEVLKFILDLRQQIYQLNRFPEHTSSVRRYTFLFTRRDNPDTQCMVELLDAPGELFEGLALNQGNNTGVPSFTVEQGTTEARTILQTPQELFEEFKELQGIILLLDPGWHANTQVEAHIYQMLFRIKLERSRDAASPLYALTLAKSDVKSEHWMQARANAERADTQRTVSNEGESSQTDEDQATSAGATTPAEALGPHNCALDAGRACANCPVASILRAQLQGSLTTLLKMVQSGQKARTGCFFVSAIGRSPGNRSNVGFEYDWTRPHTPPLLINHARESVQQDATDESAFNEAQANAEHTVGGVPTTTLRARKQKLHELSVKLQTELRVDTGDADYYPTVILRQDDIQPTNLHQPVAWIIDHLLGLA